MKQNRKVEQIVDQLTVFDDTFFHKLAEDKGFCEELVQVVLDNRNIRVIEAEPQKSLRNVMGRSVILDAYCIDETKANYDLEVQRKNEKNPFKRVRYNTSNMDTYLSEKGTDFDDLPELYAIYISLNDFYKIGKPMFHVVSVIEETGEQIDNGVKEIYVNAEVDDGSRVAQLMQIFKKSDSKINQEFPRVSSAIRDFKVGKGRDEMCELVENYAKEVAEEAAKVAAKEAAKEAEERAAKEIAKKMFSNGVKFYIVSESVSSLTEDELRNIQEEVKHEIKPSKGLKH